MNGPLFCICHHQADFGLCNAPNTHFSHDERQKQSWGAGKFSLMGVHVLCTETQKTRGAQGDLLALLLLQTIQLEHSVKILFKRKLRKEPVKSKPHGYLSLEHLKASWSHHTMASLIVDLIWVLILCCVLPLLLAQESLVIVLESIRRHTGS